MWNRKLIILYILLVIVKGELLKMDLSVFIPVFNEEKILEKNILRILRICKSLRKTFEIIIVNDASTDNSEKIINHLKKNFSEIRSISYSRGPSRRENLAQSFRVGRGKVLVFMDIDLSTDISVLEKAINLLGDQDILIGNRYMQGSFIERGLFRYLISKFYNLFVNLYFGSTFLDHQCGFKMFRKEVLMDLVKHLGYCDSFERGWFWDAELLILAQKKGYKIMELPIVWKETNKSSFSFFNEIRMIPYFFKAKKFLCTFKN